MVLSSMSLIGGGNRLGERVPVVTIYFTDGRVGKIREATDVQRLWSHAGNRGRLVILCVDENGSEVRRFPAGEIICYQVEKDTD